MAGDAAGLPVVVLVEAADPAVIVERLVEVNLVAAGAEFRNLVAHERLEEDAAVRLGIQTNHEIVQAADDGIFAGGEFVEFWIFEDEIALAHGAFHLDDAVAHHATEAGAGFGLVDVLLDGRVHHAAEEQGGIVAAGAPFGLFHAVDFLHVLDAFAIPLIVEGREVVHGALPLLVNVGMAALASLRFQEVVGGDVLAVLGLNGAGEKFAVGAVAFLVHGGGCDGGIADAVGIFPGDGAGPPGGGGNGEG